MTYRVESFSGNKKIASEEFAPRNWGPIADSLAHCQAGAFEKAQMLTKGVTRVRFYSDETLLRETKNCREIRAADRMEKALTALQAENREFARAYNRGELSNEEIARRVRAYVKAQAA